MIYTYQLHKEIMQMIKERKIYENKYTEGNELIQVQESLNNRIITLKEQLLEQPDNPNLNFELTFCQSEIERINQELEEFQEKYETNESQIKKHEEIIDYNLKELYQYIKYLEELETDEILIKAMKDTLESLENNITQLNNIKK